MSSNTYTANKNELPF